MRRTIKVILRRTTKLVYRFLSLSSVDRLILIHAVSLQLSIRLGLWLVSLQTLRRLVAKASQPVMFDQSSRRVSVDQISWAVRVTGRYIPTTTCLTQALTTYVLLRRRGYPAGLRIGVAKQEDTPLAAHAWVESDGKTVSGDIADLSRYSVLLTTGE